MTGRGEVEDQQGGALVPHLQALQYVTAWARGERELSTLDDLFRLTVDDWPLDVLEAWLAFCSCPLELFAGTAVAWFRVPELVDELLDELDEPLIDALDRHPFTVTVDGDGAPCANLPPSEHTEAIDAHLVRPDLAPLRRRGVELRRRLGSAVPLTSRHFDDAVGWALGSLPDDDPRARSARSILLWAAGPYHLRDGWLLSDHRLPEHTRAALTTGSNPPTVSDVLGVHPELVSDWVRHVGIS